MSDDTPGVGVGNAVFHRSQKGRCVVIGQGLGRIIHE